MAADTPAPSDFNPADYRILVVDDDAGGLTLMQIILGRAGYQVEIAHDGPEGLALLDTQHFDLAIVDTMMPGWDGFEVAGRIRADPRWSTMLVIIRGFGDVQREKNLAIEAGADGYVNGPIVPKDVVVMIHDMLLKGRQRDQGQ